MKLQLKLRSILLQLSLLTILSASTGGYLYYSSLRDAAFKEAERQVVSRLQLITKNITSFLSENIKVVKALAGSEELLEMLVRPNRKALDRANAILDLYKDALQVDVCYLMNHEGNTVASSNRNAPDSFVGKNFAFRPYFQEAFHSAPATYLALGVTSSKRGVYYSYPIFVKGEDLPIGLVVIKASIEQIEKDLDLINDEILLMTDSRGVVFISNEKEWLYKVLWQIGPAEREQIAKSRQFGSGPWEWIGFSRKSANRALDRSGSEYQIYTADIDNYPGWKVIHMRRLSDIAQSVSAPLIRITGPVVLTLCLLVGFSVFFLYQKANTELLQRRTVQKALRKSEERYRTLYLHTPAMLHSIDMDGRLVSVSDHWTEALGFPRSEVIGQPLTRFLTPQSQRYYEETVFPEFFRTGFCKEIPYQFVKKNGEIIDVLLSAIADRDSDGNPIRSLAVSIDVTERKRAEEALRLAKEELSRYSKDLERQVRKRTREITNILHYTPAVVYIKDAAGRYRLVNPQYEALFGIQNQDVQGKTDDQVLPPDVARRYKASDAKVVEGKHSLQIEEEIPQPVGMRTYLTVKFPVYDESGDIDGICGIATDITAVKKAQNQLRRFSASIMASQEKERSALARELHDELGQMLTALRMDTVWIRDRLRDEDPAAKERALTMCRLIDKALEDVRGLAHRLRPGVLDDLGLVDALEDYTTEFEKRTGITCIFDHQNIPATTDTVATAAYRITQEALTNVARHAEASRVDVVLKAERRILNLLVIDDGSGFDYREHEDSGGLGLAGMQERAALSGGKLEVQSRIDQGTRVNFQVPLEELQVS